MVKITKELGVGKDGYQTGGVEYKEEVGKVAVDPRSKIITNQDDPMNKINEGNTVDVRGRRRMLADKKKTATWYQFMWLQAIKLAAQAGSKIYANRQKAKMAMSEAQLLHAEKQARAI